MFGPYTPGLSTLDPVEQRRLRSGRPASRAEILGRHAREFRLDAARAHYEAEAPVSPDRSYITTNDSSLPGLVRIRHTISRMLMSAAQRIEPEAA